MTTSVKLPLSFSRQNLGVRPRVLVSAYACEPSKGSEPGCGWNYVQELKKYCDLFVLTRANNRVSIDAYESDHGPSGIQWIFYDLPVVALSLKKQFNCVSLYYLLWQWCSIQYLRRQLGAKTSFDILHHLTFGSYWRATFLYRFQPAAAFVWGPVGGAVLRVPLLLRGGSIISRFQEATQWWVQKIISLHPQALSWRRRADLVLGVSPMVLKTLGAPEGAVLSQVGITKDEYDDLSTSARNSARNITILMAGRLLLWKGQHLGLAAFHRVQKVDDRMRLIIVGSGPEEGRLKRAVHRMGMNGKVSFQGHVSRESYIRLLQESDILLFPSLHEPGAYVIVEALAAGVPVVCLKIGEPATLVEDGVSGFLVPIGSLEETVSGLSKSILQLLECSARTVIAANARSSARTFCWEKRGKRLFMLYQDVLAGRRSALS